MKKYTIEITEVVTHRVEVEAETIEQAEELALEEHIQGRSDFISTDERIVEEAKR